MEKLKELLQNEIKPIIPSEFFTLKDVKKYNDYIKSLQKQEKIPKNVDDILKLINVRGYYKQKDLDQYVPSSAKWNEITLAISNYESAQAELALLKHTSENVVYENYPKWWLLIKHTITEQKIGWNEDYDQEEEYELVSTFFTTDTTDFQKKYNHCNQELVDWDKAYLPYVNNNRHSYSGPVDLIDQALDTIKYYKMEILAYEMAERLKLKCSNIKSLFDVQKMEHYSDGWTGQDYCTKYNYVDYQDSEVLVLLEEYQTAKTQQYIKDDKYCKYPDHYLYVDFLKLMENGEYKKA